MKNTFEVEFRGRPVKTIISVYDVQYLVLTYPTVRTTVPRVARSFYTLASCVKAIKDDPTHLGTWAGQSFIVKVLPGNNEITESDTFDVTGKVVL